MRSIVFAVAIAAFIAVVASDCCTPKKWEGEAFGYSAEKNASIYEYIMYDFPNSRFRVDLGAELWSENKGIAYTIIQKMSPDGSTLQTYTINVQTGACTYTKGGFIREACVPENPTYDYAYTIGGSLKAHSYWFDRKGEMDEIVVSEEKCIPIKGIKFAHHGKHYGFDAKITYVNVIEGIRDPFSFQTPDDCKLQQ